jgi:ribulose-phosphate 3-epimerase
LGTTTAGDVVEVCIEFATKAGQGDSFVVGRAGSQAHAERIRRPMATWTLHQRRAIDEGLGGSSRTGTTSRRRRASMTGPAIVASVLGADYSRLAGEVLDLQAAGVDRIQWDVMDGVFVPNLTFGPDVIAACRKHVEVPFEAHLMVVEPDELLPRYVEAGCELLIVHAEACRHLHRTLGRIRDLGAQSAVALNPATPASAVRHVLDLCDMVLVMTVNPGFGGQDYIATMEPKVAEIRALADADGLTLDIEVDGGIGPATIAGAAAAGANVLVAGSSLYRDPDGLAHAVTDLRAKAEAARSEATGR